jgi:hypothetical protein
VTTRTTELPQAAAGWTGLTQHEAAVFRTLSWADEAAADHDYTGALAWLDVIESIGDQLPEEHQRKRATWALADRRLV